MNEVTVVGAGLAGSEAAWQLAVRGIPVRLAEMRPSHTTPAHKTGNFAELVCSNSLKGEQITGGRGDTCAVTYKDRENCPSTDGCDMVVNSYKSYNCFYNHRNPLLCPLDYIRVF